MHKLHSALLIQEDLVGSTANHWIWPQAVQLRIVAVLFSQSNSISVAMAVFNWASLALNWVP